MHNNLVHVCVSGLQKKKKQKEKKKQKQNIMILKKFGTGWQNAFEERLQDLQKFLPETHVVDVERHLGMLRIKLQSPHKSAHEIANCVAYCIERESARTCERCGKYGLRRKHEELFTEPKCLCYTCYTTELDEIVINQSI